MYVWKTMIMTGGQKQNKNTKKYNPNIKSNMWGREEREEWSEPRGWTRAPVDVWREGCSQDQDHEDDDDEVEEEDDGGGGG